MYCKSLCFQETLRRWEQIVSEHEMYDTAYLDCEAWQADITQRLQACQAPDGDKYAIQNKLTKLQVGLK